MVIALSIAAWTRCTIVGSAAKTVTRNDDVAAREDFGAG